MKKHLMHVLAAAMAAASMGAHAGSTSTNVGVTTTVIANCTVTSAPIAFGNYDSLSATPATATGSLVLTCSQGATPSIAVGLGGNAAGSQRNMSDGTNMLPYSVLRPTSNAAGASCAGAVTDYPDTAPGFALTAAPSTAPRTFNLCGSIAPGLSVPIGSYSDTVLATVTF
jgi:spore coat protein U-like protein